MRTINAKLYNGTPCCNGNKPFPQQQQSGWYVDANGNRIRQMTNAEVMGISETPYNLHIEYLPSGPLMCPECQGDTMDDMMGQFVDDLASTGEALIPIARGIAMAISYIPVFGTAVSFAINATIDLAQGQDLSDAVLSSIGDSLPGQPAAGMAFNAVRSAVSGARIDKIAIAALPVDQSIKKTLTTAIDIVQQIANGDRIDNVALDAIYSNLPPEGQQAMVLAKRIASGENLASITTDELAKTGTSALRDAAAQLTPAQVTKALQAAKDAATQAQRQGTNAVNSFIAQAGYQGAADSMPPDIRAALQSGVIVGTLQAPEIPAIQRGGLLNNSELNKSELDALAAKGKNIINSGATWVKNSELWNSPSRPLIDIRNNDTSFTINHTTRYDAVSGITLKENWSETIPIDEQFRRGFDVGIGTSEGNSQDGPGQQRIRASLVMNHAQAGFDAAQHIQFDRTKYKTFQKGLDTMAISLGRALSAADRATLEKNAARGAAMAGSSPQIAAARALNSDGRYRWGFDFATSATEGTSDFGPGQLAWRTKLGPFSDGSGPSRNDRGSNEAIQGFDVGQALQHGITKAKRDNQVAALAAQPPNIAAGILLANGITGSSSSGNVKAGVITQAQNNPQVLQGASQAIKANTGIIHQILKFFGLAS